MQRPEICLRFTINHTEHCMVIKFGELFLGGAFNFKRLVNVNRSHVLVCLSKLNDYPSLSVNHPQTHFFLLKTWIFKNRSIFFSNHYSNRRKLWGLFSHKFHALLWVFTAAEQCIGDLLTINYSSHIYWNERTCLPMQQCGSFMCFNSYWKQWNSMGLRN